MLKVVVILTVLSVVLAAPGPKLPISDNLGIIGGVITNILKFPWQVSVQINDKHICGGFLISRTWVVTAAHCVQPDFYFAYNIRAGSTLWNIGGQRINVSRIVINPKYEKANLNNDIALLKLESPVTTPFARPGVLPAAGAAVPAGASLTITGWGSTVEDGSTTAILHKVSVPTLSTEECRSAYSSSMITSEMFCAGFVGTGGKDSCKGDSGGPAVINGVVVGVVSWGFGCADPSHPGVYAKVSTSRAWIKEVTGV